MARKRKHEEHANHEAWAIPYGDLVTLLLAFFVVMYALSSVNEGKYRLLSDSLNAAFRGTPRTMEPIQIGEKQVGSGADIQVSVVQQSMLNGQPRSLFQPTSTVNKKGGHVGIPNPNPGGEQGSAKAPQSTGAVKELDHVASQVEDAMKDLIRDKLIVVRRNNSWVEVEIRTDILFSSGSAGLAPPAVSILGRLGDALKPFPNPIRVEGHTDNVRISTVAFPSNWELSAARAASVVHLFTNRGLDPNRFMVVGFGEQRPTQQNTSVEGRNANRRVVLVILSSDAMPPIDSVPAQTAANGAAENPSANTAPAAATALPPAAVAAPLIATGNATE